MTQELILEYWKEENLMAHAPQIKTGIITSKNGQVQAQIYFAPFLEKVIKRAWEYIVLAVTGRYTNSCLVGNKNLTNFPVVLLES